MELQGGDRGSLCHIYTRYSKDITNNVTNFDGKQNTSLDDLRDGFK